VNKKKQKKSTKTGLSTYKFPASLPKEWVQKLRVTKVRTRKILFNSHFAPSILKFPALILVV